MEDGRSSRGLELDPAGGSSRGPDWAPDVGRFRDSWLDWLDLVYPVFPASLLRRTSVV